MDIEFSGNSYQLGNRIQSKQPKMIEESKDDTVTIEEVKNESSDDSKEDVNTNEIPNEENSKEQQDEDS